MVKLSFKHFYMRIDEMGSEDYVTYTKFHQAIRNILDDKTHLNKNIMKGIEVDPTNEVATDVLWIIQNASKVLHLRGADIGLFKADIDKVGRYNYFENPLDIYPLQISFPFSPILKLENCQ